MYVSAFIKPPSVTPPENISDSIIESSVTASDASREKPKPLSPPTLALTIPPTVPDTISEPSARIPKAPDGSPSVYATVAAITDKAR